MGKDLFKQGISYNIKKKGEDEYTIEMPIEPDEYGRVARKCPNQKCSPGYFKAKIGTGIIDNYSITHCPYCRIASEPKNFTSNEQQRYAHDILMSELVIDEFNKLKEILKLDIKPKPVKKPIEEEVLRVVVCPHCGLDHAVFGLAIWCPDCGKDILMTHVEEEYKVVRTMLEDIMRRRENLGARIGAKDIENCLEDTVSIFEAVLKVFSLRYLQKTGKSEEEIREVFKKDIKNKFQNPEFAKEVVRNIMQQELFEGIPDNEIEFLKETFEKRHPITHNLGVIDKQYVEKVMEADDEGKEIRVTKGDIEKAIDIILKILNDLHNKVFS